MITTVYWQKLQIWLATRTEAQNRWILAGSLLGIFLFWWILQSMYEKTTVQLQADIQTTETQVNALQQRIKQMNIEIQNLHINAGEHAALLKTIISLDKQINMLGQQIVVPTQMINAIKSLIHQEPTLVLKRLENTQSQVVTTTPTIDKSAAMLYQHNFVIEIAGNYFSVLNYLTKLENLPWRIYWDSIDYKVNTYPVANVTINVHIISTTEKLN